MALLSGLNIIITRPLHQAQKLSAAISALEGNPILFPTLEIIDIDDNSKLLKAIKHLEKFDLAIFISANAVEKTLIHWPKTKAKLKIIAMGPATAAALEKFSQKVNWQAPSPYNSEALLTLSALKKIKNTQIVIFTGTNGRQLIAETLRQRGAEVKEIATYQRINPNKDISNFLPKNNLTLIISTSLQNLQNLFSSASKAKRPQLLNTQLLVISPKMITLAAQLGFEKSPVLAENASDEAILASLKAWYSKQ